MLASPRHGDGHCRRRVRTAGAVPRQPTCGANDAGVAAPPRRPLPPTSAHRRRRPAAADVRRQGRWRPRAAATATATDECALPAPSRRHRRAAPRTLASPRRSDAAPPRQPLSPMRADRRCRPAAADARPQHRFASIFSADPTSVGGGVGIGGGGVMIACCGGRGVAA